MKNDLTKEQLEQPIDVTLPLGVVLNILGNEDSVFVERAPALNLGALPAIGAPFADGIYAGPSLEDGRLVALVLLSSDNESITWDNAVEWAKKQDASLPSRIDQLVLFKNLKSEFKDALYWSGEQYAGGSGYAWCQGFRDGGQDDHYEGNKRRARAVRRVKI